MFYFFFFINYFLMVNIFFIELKNGMYVLFFFLLKLFFINMYLRDYFFLEFDFIYICVIIGCWVDMKKEIIVCVFYYFKLGGWFEC